MAFGDVIGKAFGMVGKGLGFVGDLPGSAYNAWSDFADTALPGGSGEGGDFSLPGGDGGGDYGLPGGGGPTNYGLPGGGGGSMNYGLPGGGGGGGNYALPGSGGPVNYSLPGGGGLSAEKQQYANEAAQAAYTLHHPLKDPVLPSTPGAPGSTMTFTGPATADDNKNLTAQQIDAWIAKTRPNAPINGMGAYILQAANARGVSVPQMLGIMLKESELGTTAGPNKVLGGIVAPDDPGLGGERKFNGYATWQAAIDAIAANLDTPIYKGKSLQEQIGAWYVGPVEYAAKGNAATDRAGNGTVQDYLNLVAQVYAALGVGYDPAGRPSQPVSSTGAGGPAYASIFGGATPSIGQGMERTPYSTGEGAEVYDYGTLFGLDGDTHTGWDVNVPRGTAFYMPEGMTGEVINAGGTGVFRSNNGPDGPGRGELKILLSNGMEVIFGHSDRIDVRKGDKVTAGMLLGLTGSSDGDHMHLEVRVRDPSTKSGWRIVDPSVLFGRPVGGQGGSQY